MQFGCKENTIYSPNIEHKLIIYLLYTLIPTLAEIILTHEAFTKYFLSRKTWTKVK